MAELQSWPRFASFEEEELIREKEKWNRYGGFCPVMWDITNITSPTFSDPSMQRVIYRYSEYYAAIVSRRVSFTGHVVGWAVSRASIKLNLRKK